MDINTHGVTLNFGKHSGELITRVPINYLRWMVNNNANMAEYARAEMARRGDTMPTVELSGHAIDRASLRIRKIWHENRGEDEGLYSWLMRVTLEAIKDGERLESGKIKYLGMKFVVQQGEEFPVLMSIMR